MKYVEQVLQPGETVAYATSLHWLVCRSTQERNPISSVRCSASSGPEGNASAGLPPDAAKCSVKTRGSCSLAATMTAQRPIDSAAPVPCAKGSLWGRRSVAAAARERGI